MKIGLVSSVPFVPKVHRAQNVFDVIKTILIMLSAHLEEMMPIITLANMYGKLTVLKYAVRAAGLVCTGATENNLDMEYDVYLIKKS